jgi:erythronate-4-phosphate dehydrogenase
MNIAVDEAIPCWQQAFAPFGQLRPFSGRTVRAEEVRDADLLIVRTATSVDAGLLQGSRVRFVGTATVGIDHLDTGYLDSKGIRYTNAAGCNANGVAEYVVASLLTLAERHGWGLASKSLAVVGVGHVGSLVVHKAEALGMEVLLCDPPLRESTGDDRFCDLADVLSADIVTLHVPLTKTGQYPTYHLIDRDVLERLRADQWVLNSSRGAVVDCAALRGALSAGRLAGAGLDVWEGEPSIDYSLLDLVALGTAHIAGFSLDGKIRATEMMVDAIGGYLGQQRCWDSSAMYPERRTLRPDSTTSVQATLAAVIRQAYDITSDDRLLRGLARLPAQEAAIGFDRLRTHYLLRPEFRHYQVELPGELTEAGGILEALDFEVVYEAGAPDAAKPAGTDPAREHP